MRVHYQRRSNSDETDLGEVHKIIFLVNGKRFEVVGSINAGIELKTPQEDTAITDIAWPP